MPNANRSTHYIGVKWDWAIYIVSHAFLCMYILSSGEEMMGTLPNAWYGIILCLCNSFLLPLHHWVLLLFILYRSAATRSIPEARCRFGSDKKWTSATISASMRIAFLMAVLGYILIFIWCLIRYGIPAEISSSTKALIPIPISRVIILALFSRIITTQFAAIVFITLFLFLRKKVIAFGLTLLFLLSSDFALLETPPYLSFKPVIFTSSYSFSFFIQGDWISNLIYAYFCPIVIGLILVILCKTCIWRRNLW